MRFFKKSKKESSCCNIQFEEVKEEKTQEAASACCDFKIEEVEEVKSNEASAK